MRGKDYQGLTDMSEDVDTRLSEEQKAAARKIVCAHAHGKGLNQKVADATELMMALGIHPSQVDDDMVYRTTPASLRLTGEGFGRSYL